MWSKSVSISSSCIREVNAGGLGKLSPGHPSSVLTRYTNCHWRCERTEPGGRLRGRGNSERGRLGGAPERRPWGGSERRRRGRSNRHAGRRRWCSRRWWSCDGRWRRGEAWNSWFDRGMVSTATTGLKCLSPRSEITLRLLSDCTVRDLACSTFL